MRHQGMVKGRNHGLKVIDLEDSPECSRQPVKEQKTCTQCGRTLSVDQFYRNAKNSDGRYSWCKTCSDTNVRLIRESKKA